MCAPYIYSLKDFGASVSSTCEQIVSTNMSSFAGETQEEARARRAAAAMARLQRSATASAAGGIPSGLRRYSKAKLEEDTDNFSEDRKLGVGSFGDVHLGGTPETGEYAVKRLGENLVQGTTNVQTYGHRTFLNELHVLAQFNHPNIVRAIGYGIDGNERFLVYEYLKNGNLSEYLRDHGAALTWRQRLGIAHNLATAIHHMHSKGVFHRDIKSANVCLGRDLEPKLIDCGISTIVHRENPEEVSGAFTQRVVTVTGFGGNGPIFTPGYGAPEYVNGRPPRRYGPMQEMYSLGVIFLDLLTGDAGNSELCASIRDEIVEGGDLCRIATKVDRRGDAWPDGLAERFGRLALRCTAGRTIEGAKQRPTFRDCIAELRGMCDAFLPSSAEPRRNSDDAAEVAEIASLRREIDRLNGVVRQKDDDIGKLNDALDEREQHLVAADDGQTIREGECPICCTEFGPREAVKQGVRMMCGKMEHFICDRCFQQHVDDNSSPMRIIENSGTIPGCMYPECLQREGGCNPFQERVISRHVSPEIYEKFMRGVRLHLQRQIDDDNAREAARRAQREREETNHAQRVLRDIGGLLADFPPFTKCGECGQVNELSGGDCDATRCSVCRQPFCAVCGFCDGKDAHGHCGRVHGHLYLIKDFLNGDNRVLRVKVGIIQPQIIARLLQEPEEVRLNILDELPNIGEMEPWRNYIDIGAIRDALGDGFGGGLVHDDDLGLSQFERDAALAAQLHLDEQNIRIRDRRGPPANRRRNQRLEPPPRRIVPGGGLFPNGLFPNANEAPLFANGPPPRRGPFGDGLFANGPQPGMFGNGRGRPANMDVGLMEVLTQRGRNQDNAMAIALESSDEEGDDDRDSPMPPQCPRCLGPNYTGNQTCGNRLCAYGIKYKQ